MRSTFGLNYGVGGSRIETKTEEDEADLIRIHKDNK